MPTTKSYHIQFCKVLLLMILCIPFLSEAKIKDKVVVPFEMINGMIIMKLEVNGEKGAFLLDTGADVILIDGNPTGERSDGLSTLGGNVAASITQLDQLKVGNYIRYDVAAQIMSMTTLEENLGIDLYGIIGGAYFTPHSLDIDFKNAVITISDKSAAKETVDGMSEVSFEMLNGIPVVPVEIGNQIYEFAMDSGASSHFIHSELLDKLEGIKKLDSSANVLSANHLSEKINRFEIAGFRLGEIYFEHQQCLHQNFDEVNKELIRPIAGILSLSSLVSDKVIIDFKKKRMYF